jgi:hypothetical protein
LHLSEEICTCQLAQNDLTLSIERKASKNIQAEEVASPSFIFKHINTKDGALLDYGGLAWFCLFNEKKCT